MKAARLKELEEMAAKLLETARKLRSARLPQRASGNREISGADNCSATPRFAVGTPRANGSVAAKPGTARFTRVAFAGTSERTEDLFSLP